MQHNNIKKFHIDDKKEFYIDIDKLENIYKDNYFKTFKCNN